MKLEHEVIPQLNIQDFSRNGYRKDQNQNVCPS